MTDSPDDIARRIHNAPDRYAITVVCEHGNRTARIGTFLERGDGRWYYRPHRRIVSVDGDAPEKRRSSKQATSVTALDGNQPVRVRDTDSDDVRFVYDLKCPLCPIHIRARDLRLHQAMTDARLAGEHTITLADLGGSLS